MNLKFENQIVIIEFFGYIKLYKKVNIKKYKR